MISKRRSCRSFWIQNTLCAIFGWWGMSQTFLGVFWKKNNILNFFENTLNCFAYISATKYRSEAVWINNFHGIFREGLQWDQSLIQAILNLTILTKVCLNRGFGRMCSVRFSQGSAQNIFFSWNLNFMWRKSTKFFF